MKTPPPSSVADASATGARQPMRPSISRLISLLAISGLVGLFAGCASEPSSRVVVATPGSSGKASIIVPEAPPAIKPEVVSPPPSPDYAWVEGYWAWRNNRYQWVAGQWTIPPQPGALWVAPQITEEAGTHRFHPGYWL